MYLTSSLNVTGTDHGLGKLGRHKVHDCSTSNEHRESGETNPLCSCNQSKSGNVRSWIASHKAKRVTLRAAHN